MEPYEYQVTLLIIHPSIDPQEITNTLNLEPFAKWKVGDPNAKYKGRTLKRSPSDSVWQCQPHTEKKLNSEDLYLESYIEKLAKDLLQHKSFILKLTDSGGVCKFSVAVFSDFCVGFELTPLLLKQVCDINWGIEMSIYAYPST